MKIVYCKVPARGNRENNSRPLSLERFLFLFFIAAFMIMVIAQASILSPSINASLGVGSAVEGELLGQEEYLYERGTVVLHLLGDEEENLKVLLNGDEAASFKEGCVELEVKNGDVIEIDATGLKNEYEVSVASMSENISTKHQNMHVRVKSEIKRLLKVIME